MPMEIQNLAQIWRFPSPWSKSVINISSVRPSPICCWPSVSQWPENIIWNLSIALVVILETNRLDWSQNVIIDVVGGDRTLVISWRWERTLTTGVWLCSGYIKRKGLVQVPCKHRKFGFGLDWVWLSYSLFWIWFGSVLCSFGGSNISSMNAETFQIKVLQKKTVLTSK